MSTVEQDPWPEALDAVRAAPTHHRLMFQNEKVRVLDTRVAPGEIVPLHTHRWPAVYHILSWSDIVRRGPAGEVQVDTRGRPAPAVPSATWAGPLGPHTLENVGSGVVHVVSIELKDRSP
ncbi:MAG TPA: hypothetical protein VFJ90_11880 [Candidatus Didemnitutus sp.]|nr:hypothetical protein [Candidatus Didemnitutus sp.]